MDVKEINYRRRYKTRRDWCVGFGKVYKIKGVEVSCCIV